MSIFFDGAGQTKGKIDIRNGERSTLSVPQAINNGSPRRGSEFLHENIKGRFQPLHGIVVCNQK